MAYQHEAVFTTIDEIWETHYDIFVIEALVDNLMIAVMRGLDKEVEPKLTLGDVDNPAKWKDCVFIPKGLRK